MDIYNEFTEFYAKGIYPKFSEYMLQLMPKILNRYNKNPKKILDVACGIGTFAIGMAKQGYQVTGIDLSENMLEIAKQNMVLQNTSVNFIKMDMRELNFNSEFDLVTCFYDSLNYILKIHDLKKVFNGMYNALRDNGLLIFDMNTVYGLAVNWQSSNCVIQKDNEYYFELHTTDFDFEKNIAILKIIGFKKMNNHWEKFEEIHKEKAYTQKVIENCLIEAGFKKPKLLGSIKNFTEPTPKSGRVWFVAEK